MSGHVMFRYSATLFVWCLKFGNNLLCVALLGNDPEDRTAVVVRGTAVDVHPFNVCGLHHAH